MTSDGAWYTKQSARVPRPCLLLLEMSTEHERTETCTTLPVEKTVFATQLERLWVLEAAFLSGHVIPRFNFFLSRAC